MDRTLIGPYKAEEKDLSEKLYRKLEGLMLIYPPSEEFKKIFSKDMFLKSNQLAFFQLFHYLFRIHDAAEFKKRFYWPITDKRGESNFRGASVEYLKFLSEKHNLNWNVKSYLVQIPGGMKFILFVLDLIAFVISEQVRAKEKNLGIDMSAEGFSELKLKRMQKKFKFFKDYTADYLNEVERQTLHLRHTTQLIKAELCEIENEIQVDIDRNFLKSFETSNECIFELKFEKNSQSILVFEQSLKDLKANIDKYQQKALEHRKDKNTLRQALHKLSDFQDADKPTIDSLVAAFVQIQPIMENWLGDVVQRNSAINGDMTKELIRLQQELEQIEAQISDHQRKLKLSAHFKGQGANDKDASINRNLISKYVFTPPIKADQTEYPTSHLPLLGDASFHHNLDITIKTKPMNTSFDLNTTLNRSQIIDPAQMLRTFYKNSGKKSKAAPTPTLGNLSLLGMKWKERQQLMFEADVVENLTPIKQDGANGGRLETHVDIRISSPITPFNAHSDDITRIALSSYRHSPTVKKVDVLKEDAFNIKNLSTSPTGRLESLCIADELMPAQMEAIDKSEKRAIEESENNQNEINVPKKLTFDLNLIVNDDSIFDTSDTVLKDIL